MSETPRYLSMQEMAEITGLTPESIRTYKSRGKLPAPDVLIGKTPGWTMDSVEAFAASLPGQGARTDREVLAYLDSVEKISSLVGDQTRAAIAQLVEAKIAAEYGLTELDGVPLRDVTTTQHALATLAIISDLGPQLEAAANGDATFLQAYADAVQRMLIKAGLAARECQCRQLPDAGLSRGHGHSGICHDHYEPDVPLLAGLLLCGTCHVHEHQRGRR